MVDSRYPATEQDCFALAALQCQEEFGDHPGGSCNYLYGNLHRFLPFVYLQFQRESDLEFQILRLYNRLKGLSQLDARLSYLDYVRTWRLYGSTFFSVTSVNQNIPEDVILAISKSGIIVLEGKSRELLKAYEYIVHITSWGYSDTSFIMQVSHRDGVDEKLFFQTQRGDEIHDLVQTYNAFLAGEGEHAGRSQDGGLDE